MMKKLLSVFAVLLLVLTGCASNNTEKDDAPQSDIEYIKEKGTLVVGITDFAPMDYRDSNGEWIGFDADLARIVAEDLGVEISFIEIEWDSKIFEIENKSIDVIWNGMTLTEEITSSLSCTKPYLNNAPVLVVKKDAADRYQDLESIKDLTIAVEAGSSGEGAAEANGLSFRQVSQQSDTLLEVSAGTSDAAIIDSLMAGAMIGEGTSYPELTYTVSFEGEQYGVACRKGSDLAEYLNSEFDKFTNDGTFEKLGREYGVFEALVK